jgi:hypothetical protein
MPKPTGVFPGFLLRAQQFFFVFFWYSNSGCARLYSKKSVIHQYSFVYLPYRIEAGHPLLGLDNVLLTPHLAGSTRESRARASVRAADETLRMLAGEKPRNLVNPEAWHVRRPENR